MDKKVLRDWLEAGYVEKRKLFPTQAGTPQGGIASPTIANIALDGLEAVLAERFGSKRAATLRRSRVRLVRYCDDFIIGFEHEDDARRVMAVLEKRLGRFGLTLHPDKTRLLPFWRPPKEQQVGKGPATSLSRTSLRRAGRTTAGLPDVFHHARMLPVQTADFRVD